MNMNLRHLHYFATVAKIGNITRAAEQLHIAQPALSMAIKKLEQHLELDLFQRVDRKIILTSEGKTFLAHCHLILQQVEDAELAMAELSGLKKGEVRIGVPGMLGSYFFPDILMGFKSKYPELKLTVIEAGTQSIRDMLVNGELDIGVINNENVPEQLMVEPLLSPQMVATVGISHPFATLNSISFDQFFSQKLIMFKKGYFHREFMDRVSLENHYTPNISFETNLLPMILKIVRSGSAITALLDIVSKEENNLVAVPFSEPITLNIVIARRKHGYLSIAEQTFLEYIKQAGDSTHCS